MPNPYLWIKVVHLLSVMAWFGGGLCLTVTSLLFDPATERARLVGIARAMNLIGERVVAPAGMLTLLSGLTAVMVGRIGFPFWVWWGLGAALVTLAVGIGFLKRGLERIGVVIEDPGVTTAEVAAMAGRLRRVAFVVLLIMVTTAAIMVLKPVG